jgi:hypothetical protein
MFVEVLFKLPQLQGTYGAQGFINVFKKLPFGLEHKREASNTYLDAQTHIYVFGLISYAVPRTETVVAQLVL